jgi:ubiquitin carboxyl-terminal hydrolase 4/11/15
MTIETCFAFFSQSEILDENNQWFCPNCRQFVSATKKMDIWSIPPVLVIHLKRFVGGRATASRKFDGNVEFPDILEISKFCVGPQRKANLKYRLFAVSEHSGGLSGGHYTAHAFVAPRDQGLRGGAWCFFNDSSVTRARERDAHSDTAYVLFYEQVTGQASSKGS